MIQTDSGHDVVIIAEDDQNQSLMLKDYLETVFGLQIFTAETTSSVIPLVKEKNASVLILDLQLADGDAEHLVPEAAAIDGLLVVVQHLVAVTLNNAALRWRPAERGLGIRVEFAILEVLDEGTAVDTSRVCDKAMRIGNRCSYHP